MLKCSRCGRDNPDHVTFCLDCGNRVAAVQRGVAPTPPRGMPDGGRAPMGTAAIPADPAPTGSRPPSKRPAAPDFDFSPKPDEPPVAMGPSCPSCGASNPPDHRFCTDCGQPLPAGGTTPGPEPDALAAAPVVDLAPDRPAADDRVTCSRCKGVNASTMRFCQFCGADLATTGELNSSGAVPAPPAPAVAVPAAPAPAAPPPAAAAPAPAAVSADGRPTMGSDMAGPPPEPAPAAAAPAADPAAAPGRARLVVIAQDGTPGRNYELRGEQTDIGRSEGEIQLPNDPYVSPRHVRVHWKNGRFFVRDLGSVNGVYVRLRRPEVLRNADLVLIGLEVLRFEVVSDAEKGLGPATEQGTQVFGSPAAARYARLCQRTVEGVTRDVYHLTRDETVIGREVGDIVFTGDPFMSRRHAVVARDPSNDTFIMRDLGSSNGTYLAVRGELGIEHGDHLRVGQHLFRLEVERAG